MMEDDFGSLSQSEGDSELDIERETRLLDAFKSR